MLVFVGAVNKLHDIEERTRRTEDSSKENKSALGESFLLLDTSDCPVASAQLISHTKNVERAVTMSQQDMVSKKEQQGAKLQEINHKLASVQQVGGCSNLSNFKGFRDVPMGELRSLALTLTLRNILVN